MDTAPQPLPVLHSTRRGNIRANGRNTPAAFALLGFAVIGLTFGSTSVATAAQEPTGCPPPGVSLVNSGFEDPFVSAQPTFRELPMDSVPGWKTTDPRAQIEYWTNGYLGVPSAAGSQFAEINASGVGTLYQDIATTPGQTMAWSLMHRARVGTDVMAVYIGAIGDEQLQDTLSDSIDDGWVPHSGLYTVPDGQTTTRFGFSAVSTGSGNPSIGNFLDEITFATSPCVVLTATVSNVQDRDPALVGDHIRYTVSAANGGGSASMRSVLSDSIPAGMTYLPGTLQVTYNGVPRILTDAIGDDEAEYDPATTTVRYRLGEGATATDGGAIAPTDTVEVSFQAVPMSSAAGTTIINSARFDYMGPVLPTPRLATSNDVAVTIAAAASPSPTTTPPPTTGTTTPAPTAVGNTVGQLAATGVSSAPLAAAGLIVVAAGLWLRWRHLLPRRLAR